MKTLLSELSARLSAIENGITGETKLLKRNKLLFIRKNLKKGETADFNFVSYGTTDLTLNLSLLSSSETTAFLTVYSGNVVLLSEKLTLSQNQTTELQRKFTVKGGGKVSVKISSPLSVSFLSPVMTLEVSGYGAVKNSDSHYIGLTSAEECDYFLVHSDGLLSFLNEEETVLKTYKNAVNPRLSKIYDQEKAKFLPVTGFSKNGLLSLDLPPTETATTSQTVTFTSDFSASSHAVVTFETQKTSFVLYVAGGKLYARALSLSGGTFSLGERSEVVLPPGSSADIVHAHTFGNQALCLTEALGGTYAFTLSLTSSNGSYALQIGSLASLPVKKPLSFYDNGKFYLYHKGSSGMIMRSELSLSPAPKIVGTVKAMDADCVLRFSDGNCAVISGGEFFLTGIAIA